MKEKEKKLGLPFCYIVIILKKKVEETKKEAS